MKKIVMLALFLLILSLCAEKMIHKTLPNGMELVVKENFGNNSIGYYCFVKTGSADEGKYLGDGLSHYLEHLVSGGTTEFKTEKEIQARQKEIGAGVNAYTNSRMTCYHIMADKGYSDEIRKMLLENIFHTILTKEEYEREKDVIIKEFVYRVATPKARLRQRADVVSFMDAHNKYQVIGYVDQFKKVRHEELKDYYQKRYKPNNMIFVAAGNFKAEEEFAKLEKELSVYERGTITPEYLPQERQRPGNLKFVDEFDVKKPSVYLTKVLNRGDYQDFLALELAMEILFAKRKSPVNFLLKEKLNKVNYIWGYFNDNGYYSEPMIRIGFEANDSKELDEIVEIIDAEIERIKRTGITEEQLKEIITSYKANYLLRQPSIDADCNNIGWNMFKYGVPEIHNYKMEQYEKLTAADINRVIKKYLTSNNRVTFYGVPTGTKQNLNEKTQEIAKTEAKKIEISDDLIVFYKQNSAKPIIKAQLSFPVGAIHESKEEVGLIDFLIDMIIKGGSQKYSSMDISDWLENHAVSINYDVLEAGTRIRFTCLKEDFPQLIEMLKDIFKNPVFDNDELVKRKKDYQMSYERSKDYPRTAYTDYRNSILYKGTKGALTSEEKNNIIQSVDQDKLRELYKKFLKSEKFIAGFYGDLTEDEAKKMAKQFTNIIPEEKSDLGEIPYDIQAKNGTYVNKCKFEQVQVDVNYPAPVIGSKDYYVMKVIEAIMGGGFGGRIMTATRVDNNLVYSAWGFASSSKQRGFYRFSGMTSLPNKDRLITTFKDLATKLKEEKVSEKELIASISSYEKLFKTYVTDKNLLNVLSMYELEGLGYDYRDKELAKMKEVTVEDIQRVARKYFKEPAIFVSQPDDEVVRSIE